MIFLTIMKSSLSKNPYKNHMMAQRVRNKDSENGMNTAINVQILHIFKLHFNLCKIYVT